MAVKYTIPYKSIDDTQWRVDILHDAWAGDAIAVRGFGDNACTIEYDGGTDDPFDNPVVSSKANIQLINQGEVDMDELQLAGDRDFVVEVYRDNVLKWKGYLITDNIQQPYISTPYVVQLSAIDGLNMLEGITFSGLGSVLSPPGAAIRCPLNWLRLCLFRTQNLGLPLPIRWVVGLENVETEDDALAGQMTWSPYGEGIIAGTYIDGLGNTQYIYQNCRYIVEGIVKALGCRIFQADGAWWVVRSNDILPQEITYKECEATLGVPTITTHSVDIGRAIVPQSEPIGDYRFIKEDALLTVKPALGMVDVEYDSDSRENILPNGGMDFVDAISQRPIYWGMFNNPGANGDFERYDSLRPDSTGYSVMLTNALPAATSNARFYLNGGLPIDANILFKRFIWGFTILPLKGFTYNAETGYIIWDNHPIRVRMSYHAKWSNGVEQTLWLNRWGFWQPEEPAGGWIYLVGVNYSSGPGTAEFAGVPQIGDVLTAGFKRAFLDETVEYSYIVESTTAGDLSATLAAWASEISGATSTSTTISIPDPGAGDWIFSALATSGKDNLLPGNWIDIAINEAKVGDVISVVFQGKGGSNEILIPDPGALDGGQTPEAGVLNIEFSVAEGQRYVLDDIYIRVEENNDVYRVTSPVAGNDTSQRITMGISSSFSGFMVSNMMRSYHQSNRDFVWTDGTTEASLTEHYARQVMRWRYKPSRIFNGTINTRLQDWSFIHLYLIYGLESVFLPLKARYNTELCEVDLVAMEGRDDGEITDVKHYASNNMPLSNFGG